MIRNAVVALPFSASGFQDAISRASRAEGGGASTQAVYVSRYAERLGAKSVVHEAVYVDRHYMDEYTAYYARKLSPPPHVVQRFHLFSRSIDDAELTRLADEALSSVSARETIEQALSVDYLGFVTVRPIPSVPIGRTVLRRLADEPNAHRDIWATTTYDAHLGNLKLRVAGLAFQQQDAAVGACATAALWSALSRVARHEGMRAPTPSDVSEAAGRHVLPFGRTMPAVSGLSMGQLCDAIRTLGFAPEAFTPGQLPEVFLLAVHTYLLSGIPVVLGLWNEKLGGHAVTAVGFQASETPNPQLQTSVQVRSAALNKLYVHDDRLGPYARAPVFYRPNIVDSETGQEIDEALLLGIDEEIWSIDSAVAPVYPKLRLPVGSLLVVGELLAEAMEKIVGQQEARKLTVEFQYERSGDYLGGLSGRVAFKAGRFFREAVLPRWCAIVRWHLGSEPLAEFVYDTTDILRNDKQLTRELVRAVVCLAPPYVAELRELASLLKAPFLPG